MILILILAADADGTISVRQEAVFEDMYKKYNKQLYVFIYQMTHDSETTLDILQESFARVLSAEVEFESEKGSRNYLYTVAANLCRMQFRRNKYRDHASIDKLGDAGIILADTKESFEKKIELSQIEDILNSHVEKLPEKERSILLMKKTKGMTYTDIAQVTGMSERQLKRIVKKCIEVILEGMEEDGIVGEGGLL